ncbi:MAG: hypothetical protein AUH11_00195 [Acidobacteria bacterium 13_2_20CM_57_17]|nr:MAG: hypothetical protein AUH11_00195 [Acidobacteria bacterium 13_2_20CM_57_17]
MPAPDGRVRPRRAARSLRRQRVGEDDGALLGEPQRRLVAATPVVKGDEASRKLAAGLDELQVGLGDVLAKEETRAKRAGIIAAREEINVANVIGLENDDGRRRTRVEPLPELGCVFWRSKRIEKQSLATGLNAGRGHDWLPSLPWLPARMFETPDP